MAEKQIQDTRIKHKAIAHFMVANPTVTQNEIAREFGLTPAWLSIIVNSDCFREYVAELDEDFRHAVLTPLREKLVGVASRAVDKLAEALDDSQNPDFILEVADKTLHRLGYAPSKGPEAPTVPGVAVQNNFYVSRDTLAEARGRMLEAAVTSAREQDEKQLPAPEELPAR